MFDKLIGPVTDLIGKFIPDKTEAAKLAHELATMADKMTHEELMAQIEVNKEDAKSGNWWQSGWRPFFGWVGGAAFFNNFILLPYASVFWPEIQALDFAAMMPVVMGILGLGGYRTFEKKTDVERNR